MAYQGNWKETKIKPRTWKFKYTFYTKKKPEYKVARIKATQYALKTTPNKYSIIMKGKKKIIKNYKKNIKFKKSPKP
jgi:hypothetical protein